MTTFCAFSVVFDREVFWLARAALGDENPKLGWRRARVPRERATDAGQDVAPLCAAAASVSSRGLIDDLRRTEARAWRPGRQAPPAPDPFHRHHSPFLAAGEAGASSGQLPRKKRSCHKDPGANETLG